MLSIKLILGMELNKPAGANVFPIICKDQWDRRSASGLLISEYIGTGELQQSNIHYPKPYI